MEIINSLYCTKKREEKTNSSKLLQNTAKHVGLLRYNNFTTQLPAKKQNKWKYVHKMNLAAETNSCKSGDEDDSADKQAVMEMTGVWSHPSGWRSRAHTHGCCDEVKGYKRGGEGEGVRGDALHRWNAAVHQPTSI